MRRTKLFLLFINLLLIIFSLNAQEKYSKVKIYSTSIEERNNLLGLAEIDHYYMEDGAVISEIGAHSIEKLKAANAQFEILVDDVAANLDKLNTIFFEARKRGDKDALSRITEEQGGGVAMAQSCKTVADIITTPSSFVVQTTFGGYYSYAQMSAAMDALVAKYPGLVQKISLGKSIEKRDIWAVKISDNVSTDETTEPEVLYMGLQHAREAIGGSSMIFFMQYLLENYATDTKIKNLVDNREFYIVPCVNPDGYEYNRTLTPNGGGNHRKNRRDNTTYSDYRDGVDLNRNYGIDWGNCSGATTSCGSNSATAETYYGTAAFSEPETQAIRTLVTTHHFVAAIDQHAYGPYYSLPFGRPSLHLNDMQAWEKKFFTVIPALMGTYNGMRAGNSPESVNYEVAGGVKDWWLLGDIGTGTKGKIYGMTGEGGAGGGRTDIDANMRYFWAPSSQIENLCKGMCFQNLQLAYAAGSYVQIQDMDDIMVSLKSGSFNFKVTRIGLGNNPVKVSLINIENIQTAGNPVTIATTNLPAFGDSYTGSINFSLPTKITNGQRIRFAWMVETGGYIYSDTITKFYNPVELFSDDMEGTNMATNWTITTSPSTAPTWAYTTSYFYAGKKSLTESTNSSTRYAASSILTAKCTKTFNLSDATAAYLSFWTRHRAENFRDKLQVQVSTNGTDWVPVCGSTTVQEPGTLDGSTIKGEPSLTGIREDWTRELFDLSNYKNANLQLRFAFTSDPSSSSTFDYKEDDGFYIDNLKVVKSTATLTSLPVTFLNFTGLMLSNKTVKLNWDAYTDELFDQFEVERSSDGVNYATIGKGPGYAPYSFIDQKPLIGENYYRIKEVDKNGSITLSRPITIVNQSDVSAVIYPNPITTEFSIKLSQKNPQALKFQVVDMMGHVVYSEERQGTLNTIELNVDAKSWRSGIYMLKITNSDNKTILTKRLVKY